MIATITQALQRGDNAAALSAAQAFVISEAHNPQAHHWLGICLQRSGDIAGARAAIDEAINLAPDRADFQISRAALALEQKDYAAAEQGMKDVVNLDPNQLQAYVTLAHMALARGENDAAAKQLKLAQRINPGHPHVLLLEGHVAQYSGQPDHALKCFTAAAETDPKNSLAQVSLGMAYGARGMWPFAEQALNNAIVLEPANPGVLRGLVRSQLQQKKFPEAIDMLGKWLINKPADHTFRMMRAQVRASFGQVEEALEDLLMVNAASPGNPQVIGPLINVLAILGRSAEAFEHLEAALAQAPKSNLLWAMRVSMADNDVIATLQVVQRWLEAIPESPQAHEALAQLRETLGELDAAEISADTALSLQQNLPHAQFIKLRAEIRNDPKQALSRLEMLERAASNPDSERMVFAWRGLTYDKMQQYGKAAESFRQMSRRMLQQHRLPRLFPAATSQGSDCKGTLLWAPAGTRVDAVLRALVKPLGARLLADRNLATARQDGFGHVRGVPGTEHAGSMESWQSAIRQTGLEPEAAVDWITHIDGYTISVLNGVRTVAVVSDPRDALVNWMVFGSAQGFLFNPDETISADWLAQTCEAFAEHLENNPESVSMIKIDDLQTKADSVIQALQTALELDQVPDSNMLGANIKNRNSFDNHFPSGHWRHYRDSFKAAFDRLTPVAVRLGYSED